MGTRGLVKVKALPIKLIRACTFSDSFPSTDALGAVPKTDVQLCKVLAEWHTLKVCQPVTDLT